MRRHTSLFFQISWSKLEHALTGKYRLVTDEKNRTHYYNVTDSLSS